VIEPAAREGLVRLGALIRYRRQRAKLTLRQLAERAGVSNPYLSQVERGLHEPSVRVLGAIAAALDLPADLLLAEAGLLDRAPGAPGDPAGVLVALDADPYLLPEQKAALAAVYRAFVDATPPPGPSTRPASTER
jgi:transcriptional regulator with XRE-family HTH domain